MPRAPETEVTPHIFQIWFPVFHSSQCHSDVLLTVKYCTSFDANGTSCDHFFSFFLWEWGGFPPYPVDFLTFQELRWTFTGLPTAFDSPIYIPWWEISKNTVYLCGAEQHSVFLVTANRLLRYLVLEVESYMFSFWHIIMGNVYCPLVLKSIKALFACE